jgi:hypothetical protein
MIVTDSSVWLEKACADVSGTMRGIWNFLEQVGIKKIAALQICGDNE